MMMQKPFPDKTFYVFEGRPYCQHHYHEANDSLCAAALCGQPIEGPCAVSHAGDRYHPDHLVCEYAGCDERLEDYWEVDGRMLCERHARRVEEEERRGAPPGEEEAKVGRAMKRKTRLINLDSGLR
jgi:PDZ and LIM domain protein 5/6/7